MADNTALPASGTNAATDEVTYSGDTAVVQLVRFVQVTGSEGSKTVVDLPGDATNGQLVNLGSNNDVTVTGTVTANLAAGTNNIGDVDVLSVVPGTAATNLGKAIDTALGATDTGVLALSVRDDALATLTEADGDVSALRVDSTGRLWCNVSNTVTVGSHAVTNAGTFAVQVDGSALTSLQLLDDAVATSGSAAAAKVFQVAGSDGSAARILSTTGAGLLNIALSDGGGTAISASTGTSGAALRVVHASDDPVTTAVQLIDDSVFADDAAFTVGTSKVNIAGAVAVAHGSNPDAADALDAVATITNRHRVPFSIGGHPNIVSLKHTTITTAVTDAAIITVSGGTKIVVTGITATLDNASTVFPTLLVGFGAANTPTTTGVILAHGGVPAGGGVNRGDGSGIIGIGADGEDLRVTTTGNATGNGLQIVVTYFLIES